MADICCMCLSVQRKLTHMNSVQFSKATNVLKLNITHWGPICWECDAMMSRLAAFMRQVAEAQTQLGCYLNTPIPFRKNPDGYSKLSHFSKDTYDAHFAFDELELETTVKMEIKEECVETTETEVSVQTGECSKSYDDDYDHDHNDHHDDHHDASEKPLTLEDSYELKVLGADELEAFRNIDRKASKYAASPYKCETCIVGFYSEKKHDSHLRREHSQINIHECRVCLRTFSSTEEAQTHLEEHYQLFSCKLCPQQTLKRRQIMYHFNNVHRYSSYKCRECSKEFTTNLALRYHRAKEHTEPSCCEHCGKKCKSNYDLNQHLEYAHSATGVPRFECPVCRKWLRGRGGLRTHLRGHKAPAGGAYCAECDVTFKSDAVYKNHLKYSSKHRIDEPRFECHDCGRVFHQKHLVRVHIMRAHLKKSDIKCHLCNRNFFRHDRLRDHIKYTHEGAARVKDKVCTYCWKAFDQQTVLRRHLRTHTGEKPFCCEHCGARFNQKSTLVTHVRGVHLKMKIRK